MKKLRFVNMALLAAGLLLVQQTTSAQVVTTLAGSGARGSVDGTGAEASFSGPIGLAVDSSGNVYVADRGNHKIRKITPSGTVTTLAGSGNVGGADGRGTAASFRYPNSVAVDTSGNVYVTEQSYWSYGGGSDADIRKITPDGEVTTVAALKPFVMSEVGVTVDASGSFYVADGGDVVDGGLGKILKITSDGRVTTVAGDSTPYPVSNPWGVVADALGHLYVTDPGTGYLTKLIPGSSSTVLAKNLSLPAGAAVDHSGNVYVVESGVDRIRKVAVDGTVTTIAGSGLAGNSDGTGTAASFNSPTGVALDRSGNLYVADSGNNKIRKIALQGGRLSPVFGVLDLSVRPDGTTSLLRMNESTRQTSFDTLDETGSVTSGSLFGPYTDWTPRATATGEDALTRLLWNNVDGSAAIWLTGPLGNQASFRLGPVSGATATDVAAAAAGTTHLLWTYADGRIVVWSIDNAGNVSPGPVYGPFPGWTAVAIADGEDGLSRILWSNSDGSAALWFLGQEGLAASARFGPVSGWTAADIAVGADGLTRILWTHRDGRMTVWSVDSSGNPRNLGPIYTPPPGRTASRIATGSDGLTRVLWTSVSEGALLWTLSADNAFQKTFVLDSAPTSDSWDVTIQVTAVTGPDFCIVTPSVGMAFSTIYEVRRSGGSVSFIHPDPLDWDTFTASLNGSNFTAAIPPIGSGGGMCTHYLTAYSFSGSFSPDGNHFTATETQSFTLDSGQVKIITFSWSGSRR